MRLYYRFGNLRGNASDTENTSTDNILIETDTGFEVKQYNENKISNTNFESDRLYKFNDNKGDNCPTQIVVSRSKKNKGNFVIQENQKTKTYKDEDSKKEHNLTLERGYFFTEPQIENGELKIDFYAKDTKDNKIKKCRTGYISINDNKKINIFNNLHCSKTRLKIQDGNIIEDQQEQYNHHILNKNAIGQQFEVKSSIKYEGGYILDINNDSNSCKVNLLQYKKNKEHFGNHNMTYKGESFTMPKYDPITRLYTIDFYAWTKDIDNFEKKKCRTVKMDEENVNRFMYFYYNKDYMTDELITDTLGGLSYDKKNKCYKGFPYYDLKHKVFKRKTYKESAVRGGMIESGSETCIETKLIIDSMEQRKTKINTNINTVNNNNNNINIIDEDEINTNTGKNNNNINLIDEDENENEINTNTAKNNNKNILTYEEIDINNRINKIGLREAKKYYYNGFLYEKSEKVNELHRWKRIETNDSSSTNYYRLDNTKINSYLSFSKFEIYEGTYIGFLDKANEISLQTINKTDNIGNGSFAYRDGLFFTMPKYDQKTKLYTVEFFAWTKTNEQFKINKYASCQMSEEEVNRFINNKLIKMNINKEEMENRLGRYDYDKNLDCYVTFPEHNYSKHKCVLNKYTKVNSKYETRGYEEYNKKSYKLSQNNEDNNRIFSEEIQGFLKDKEYYFCKGQCYRRNSDTNQIEQVNIHSSDFYSFKSFEKDKISVKVQSSMKNEGGYIGYKKDNNKCEVYYYSYPKNTNNKPHPINIRSGQFFRMPTYDPKTQLYTLEIYTFCYKNKKLESKLCRTVTMNEHEVNEFINNKGLVKNECYSIYEIIKNSEVTEGTVNKDGSVLGPLEYDDKLHQFRHPVYRMDDNRKYYIDYYIGGFGDGSKIEHIEIITANTVDNNSNNIINTIVNNNNKENNGENIINTNSNNNNNINNNEMIQDRYFFHIDKEIKLNVKSCEYYKGAYITDINPNDDGLYGFNYDKDETVKGENILSLDRTFFKYPKYNEKEKMWTVDFYQRSVINKKLQFKKYCSAKLDKEEYENLMKQGFKNKDNEIDNKDFKDRINKLYSFTRKELVLQGIDKDGKRKDVTLNSKLYIYSFPLYDSKRKLYYINEYNKDQNFIRTIYLDEDNCKKFNKCLSQTEETRKLVVFGNSNYNKITSLHEAIEALTFLIDVSENKELTNEQKGLIKATTDALAGENGYFSDTDSVFQDKCSKIINLDYKNISDKKNIQMLKEIRNDVCAMLPENNNLKQLLDCRSRIMNITNMEDIKNLDLLKQIDKKIFEINDEIKKEIKKIKGYTEEQSQINLRNFAREIKNSIQDLGNIQIYKILYALEHDNEIEDCAENKKLINLIDNNNLLFNDFFKSQLIKGCRIMLKFNVSLDDKAKEIRDNIETIRKDINNLLEAKGDELEDRCRSIIQDNYFYDNDKNSNPIFNFIDGNEIQRVVSEINDDNKNEKLKNLQKQLDIVEAYLSKNKYNQSSAEEFLKQYWGQQIELKKKVIYYKMIAEQKFKEYVIEKALEKHSMSDLINLYNDEISEPVLQKCQKKYNISDTEIKNIIELKMYNYVNENYSYIKELLDAYKKNNNVDTEIDIYKNVKEISEYQKQLEELKNIEKQGYENINKININIIEHENNKSVVIEIKDFLKKNYNDTINKYYCNKMFDERIKQINESIEKYIKNLLNSKLKDGFYEELKPYTSNKKSNDIDMYEIYNNVRKNHLVDCVFKNMNNEQRFKMRTDIIENKKTSDDDINAFLEEIDDKAIVVNKMTEFIIKNDDLFNQLSRKGYTLTDRDLDILEKMCCTDEQYQLNNKELENSEKWKIITKWKEDNVDKIGLILKTKENFKLFKANIKKLNLEEDNRKKRIIADDLFDNSNDFDSNNDNRNNNQNENRKRIQLDNIRNHKNKIVNLSGQNNNIVTNNNNNKK